MTEDEWTCLFCGSTEPHHAMRFPVENAHDYDFDEELDDEIEVDVTCKSVYITPVDGGDGFAFTHEEFELLIEHYENRPDFV